MAPEATAQVAMAPAGTAQVAMVPVSGTAAVAGGPFAAPGPGVPMMVQQTAPAVASTTQTVSAPRSRVAIGFDTVRVPIPVLRFFSVPGPQEVTTRTQYYPAQQTVAPQQTMAMVQVAQPTTQFVAQPAVAVAPQAQMAVQPAVAVAQPAVAQPAVAVAQPAVAVAPQSQFAVQATAAAPCPPNVSKETLDALADEIQKVQNVLDGRPANAPPKK
jgi:hypothetical protein